MFKVDGLEINNHLILYFNDNKSIKKVVLFGSRAKENYKYNSDIDLGILCDKKYKGTIAEELDELVGIYSLDIVFLDNMNEEIKLQIEKYGIEIYNNMIMLQYGGQMIILIHKQ
ncbi:MAG: nucleotidyltransferase domain-containing protein [Clostridium butyricum]|nr:nucleotidyltransferase domain-containing protein [Clostridium butyricum]